MRALVIGGTGLIGNALVRAWARRGAEVVAATHHRHIGASLRRLDMRDEAAVRSALAELRPEVVAVPAANPHVDYCELHPEQTRRVNVVATLQVARACQDVGARMIFFSSDYVFDGRKGVYTEEDPTNPINEYGRQKVEAEAGVLGADARNLVVRTSGAYGWQWNPKNFVLQIKSSLEAGRRLPVAADFLYNPTAADNLADAVLGLVERGLSGVFHAVGADRLARYDFAVMVARAFGLDAALLDAVPSACFNSPTPRPRFSSLDTSKLRALGVTPLWGAAEGLERMKNGEAAWHEYSRAFFGGESLLQ